MSDGAVVACALALSVLVFALIHGFEAAAREAIG